MVMFLLQTKVQLFISLLPLLLVQSLWCRQCALIFQEEWQNLHRLGSSSKELQNSVLVEKPYYNLGKLSSLSNTMPSRQKTLMFTSAFFTSLCSFVIVCIVLATKNWVSSTTTNVKENPNMTLIITYGLFQGVCSDVSPGISSAHINFQVAGTLKNDTLKIFHGVIIFLLVVTMLSSFLCSGFTCYNAISNPYQTFLGPIGVYTWNSVSCICCLLNLILFAVNVEVNKLSAELAINHCKVFPGFEQRNSYGYSYWVMLLIIALNATTVIIIVFYQRAKYSKKKERERPLDSAPKDGILF